MIPSYPRTYHIGDSRMDPGVQNPEGILFSDLENKYIVIEEKVDGCQVGIYFEEESLIMKCFTRNTFITSNKRQKHFIPFLQWCNSKESELFDVLENRYVLYFEWAYALHTIYYDALPEYGIECDLFDRITGKFVSTQKRQEILASLNLTSAPVLYSGPCISESHLKSLLRPSQYITSKSRANLVQTLSTMTSLDHANSLICSIDVSGMPEGFYIKVEDADHVLERYKWVRKDFINLILNSKTHWVDRILVSNGVKNDNI